MLPEKETVEKFIFALLYNLWIFLPIATGLSFKSPTLLIFSGIAAFILAIVTVAKFPRKQFERKHLTLLYRGNYSLEVFVLSCSFTILTVINGFLWVPFSWPALIFSAIWIILMESLLFWNGMLRVFASSVQLGLKKRIIMTSCGWIPLVNIYMLLKIIRIVRNELAFEIKKDLTSQVAEQSTECQTKYPILLVHGVFFRDSNYLNYWGRIPRFLKQRGAKIYYGKQESAQSVAYCGEQLAQTIQTILKETGCEKVNIIAHSKGGLDSRYAISNLGMQQAVASLTTINTPHHGCIFANYLLKKAPKKLVKQVENKYNAIFKQLGDQNADFLAAVNCLTDETCTQLNAQMPDMPAVYYQGITTYVQRATNGKFPLNITYPVVKHFDGRNDGLVSIESASYFRNNRVISPKGRRGISHADVIDLNRENIEGFDVRGFYQEIVVDLKARGF